MNKINLIKQFKKPDKLLNKVNNYAIKAKLSKMVVKNH